MSLTWTNLHTQIETLSHQNRSTLDQIQQRKNQKVIIGYEYEMKCDFSSPSKKRIKTENETSRAASNRYKAWEIVSTPKTSDVNSVLDNWKYEGENLEHDDLFFGSYIDLTLKSFTDLERLVGTTSDIGDKYIMMFNEESDKTLNAFEIMSKNLQKIRDVLEELRGSVTDAVETITKDTEVKQKMDQLIENFDEVREKFPKSLVMKNNNFNAQFKMDMDTEDRRVDIGDIKKLRCVQTFNAHTNVVVDIQIYEIDGEKFLASGGEDKNIKLHRLSDKSLVATLTGHTKVVNSLALYKNTDGKQYLASSSHDGSVRLWDLHENQCIATLSNPSNSSAFGLATFKKDDRHLIACGYVNGDIIILDLESHTEVATLKGHGVGRQLPPLLVFGKDDQKFLVSGSQEKTIKVWNLENYSLVKSIQKANSRYVLCLASFEFEGKTYVVSGGYGDVKVWDTEDFSLVSTFAGHSDNVFSMKACEYNGSVTLVSASHDRTVKFWDVSNKQLLHTLNCDHEVGSLDIYENDNNKACLVTGGVDGSLKFWME